MLEREGYSDTFVTDIPFSRVSEFKQAVQQRRSRDLYGIGADEGTLALFGSPSRFEGREVSGYHLGSSGQLPYPTISGGDGVDWGRTEKINAVPTQDIDPRGLTATQPFVTHGGLHHYLSDTSGSLYDRKSGESNQFPTVFEDEQTGERRILTGHHRATAALLLGTPMTGRLVRGQLLKRGGPV